MGIKNFKVDNVSSPDEYNRIIHEMLPNVMNVECVSIAPTALDIIDPKIVTQDNIWAICVAAGLICPGDTAHKLYKVDVLCARISKGYCGEAVIEAVKKLIRTGDNDGITLLYKSNNAE